MKSTISTLRALSLLLMLGTATATLAEPAGEVLKIKGTASAKDAKGATRTLSIGSTVNAGDTVVTEAGSAININMRDGALLALSGDSLLILKAYAYKEANGAPDKVELFLERGDFHTITGDVPKSKYLLTTPIAAVKVLGTAYDMQVSNGVTTIILREPTLEVINSTTGEKIIMNVPGMMLIIRANEPIEVTEEDILTDTSDYDRVDCITCPPLPVSP